MKLLIQNGSIVDPTSDKIEAKDIFIEDGRIVKVGKQLNVSDCKVIDSKKLMVLPGLVDAHCHLRDPGFEYKEDISSGTRSAAKGGFTSVACMPNTKPLIDDKTVISYILNKAKEEGVVKVFPIACVTKGQSGEELTDMGLLKEAGAVGVSDDGKPVVDAGMMKNALLYASMFDLPVISHCEDLSLVKEGAMNEGVISARLGLQGIPSAAEDVMVAREMILAEYTGKPVHIAHVSTALSIALIREAKKRGAPVTAETCPHYFSITEESCDHFNTYGKVNPPLRSEADNKAIIEGLRDGTIDIIATDHAPHHEDDKNRIFQKADNGMVGFETAFSLALTFLYEPGLMTLQQIAKKMSTNPASLLKIDGGAIKEGMPADLIMVDTQTEYVFDREKLVSKSKNSPFHGMTLKGSIKHTIVEGEMVVEEGDLVRGA